jgi:hypothetical protein
MLIPDDGVNAALRASPSQQRAHAQPGLDVPAQGGILGKSGFKTGSGSGSAYRKPDPDLHQHDADPHHRMSAHHNFIYKKKRKNIKNINSSVFFFTFGVAIWLMKHIFLNTIIIFVRCEIKCNI